MPLSFGQQANLLQRMRAAPGALNQHIALQLDPEPADEASIRRFLDLLASRVDALRAVLVRGRGGPGLAFHEPFADGAPVPLSVERPLDLETFASKGFGRGELLSAAAIDPADPGRVHLVIDHLVFDGWSRILLAEEAARVWATITSGEALPAPGGSLREYMQSQRDEWDPASHEEYSRFWNQEFEHDYALALPSTDSDRWKQVDFPCPADVAELLAAARQRHRTTDFTIVLAAFTTALLALTPSQRSLLVYCPVADRDLVHGDTIGCLTNQIGIRVRVGATLEETIHSSRQGLFRGLEHQHGPFHALAPKSGDGAMVLSQPNWDPLAEAGGYPGTAGQLPTSSDDDWRVRDSPPRPLGHIYLAFTSTGSCHLEFTTRFFEPDTAVDVVHTVIDLLRSEIDGVAPQA